MLGSDPIRHQTLLGTSHRTFQRHHHAFAHIRMRTQPCLDFTQFDAETTDLDLMIVAPEKLNRAIGTPTPQIATAIHPRCRIGTKRIRQEAFGGQVLSIQISKTHAIATDIQLAHHPNRNRRTVCIKNVDLRVGDWPADWKTSDILIDFHRLIGRRDGRDFRRAIAIQEMLWAVAIQDLRHHAWINRITTGQQITQVTEPLFHALSILMEQPRR